MVIAELRSSHDELNGKRTRNFKPAREKSCIFALFVWIGSLIFEYRPHLPHRVPLREYFGI